MKKYCPRLFRYITYLFISFFLFSSFIVPVHAQEVLGEATSFSENQKNLLVAKPAVVQITNISTGQLIMQSAIANQLGAPQLTGAAYDFTVGFSGSGFFINPDGYLITNGHVAKPTEDLIAYYALAQNAKQIFKDALYYVLLSNYGYTPTEAELEQAYQSLLQDSYGGNYEAMVQEFYSVDYKGGNIEMDGLKRSSYIQTGTVAGTQKEVKELGEPATLVDTSYEGEFDSKDLALLKVNGSNFPTIELGSFANVEIGKEVYVIGYPGIVESGTGVFTDNQSQLEPSITRGIISAKMTLVDGTEAFQTDSAISHGNSGGPSIDTDGKVIGVATWGFGDNPGGAGFNFLISVEQVESLLQQNNVTTGTSLSTEKWSEGLQFYSDKCYAKAKDAFEGAQDLYPNNVDIEDFISKSQTAIEKGEDECAGLNIPGLPDNFSATTYIVVCSCLFLLGLVLVGGVIVIVMRRRKKS